VRLIVRKNRRGLSSAVLRGFSEARGWLLMCMDADLSHPPEAIAALVAAVNEPGVQFVLGSRYVAGGSTDRQWGVFRSLNSKVATLLARPFTQAKDPMSGFFVIPRSVFQEADELSPVGYKIGLELIVKCRCRRVREVPIHFADRKFGQSKLGLAEQFRYLRHLKRLADYKFGWLASLVEFCLVGLTGIIVDLGSFWLLLRVLPITVARALAIWLAMTCNFFGNRRFTFSHSRHGDLLVQYVKFVATCGLGALVNWSTSVGLAQWVGFFSRHVLVAAVAGIILGTMFNFTLSYLWVFRRGKPRP
jgi:dolichol-phosphate mannosyltransferase